MEERSLPCSSCISSLDAGSPRCPICGDSAICTTYSFNDNNHSNSVS